ncbi:cation:proton antiporter [Methanosalsum zhilinae]|nr:cation:proton antiporter [Methanosalsum zhilinae]
MLSSFPITNPALIFAMAMLVFLVTPLIFKYYRLPGIVGIIIVGAIIGPNALNILDRNETIILLGEIGLIYLMFLAGLEINVNKFIEKIDRSLVFGSLSFLIPQIAGTLVGIYVIGLTVPAALLFAAIFASHTLLAYPVIKKLGIVKNEAITAAVGGTIITDTLALLVLAVVLTSTEADIGTSFWLQLGVGLAIFFIGVWTIVPRISRWFFSNLTDESYFEFLYVMTILFICAYLAEVAGVEAIIGAFFSGLVLNRLIPKTGPLMNRIEFIGNSFFIPFFLLSVGMLVDARIFLQGIHELTIAFWLITLLLITKFIASWITGVVYRYDINQILSIFGLSTGQAAAALAIVLIGYDAGILDQMMINSVVAMILVIGIISPTIVEKYGNKVSMGDKIVHEASEMPQRILVPFSSQSIYKEFLLDLAMIIKNKRSEEPLNALCVIKIGPDPGMKIIEAEKALEEAKKYAASAETMINTQVRLNYNIASGIIRAVQENRINTTIIGWDGTHSVKEGIIGSIIDQVLEKTDKLTLVSHLENPLCNTKRITIIMPYGIDHNPGISQTIRTIKRIAEETGAKTVVKAVGDQADKYEKTFSSIKPDIPTQFEMVESRAKLLNSLHKNEGRDELIIYVSARRNTPGWHPSSQKLPVKITSFFKGNLIIAYPGTEDATDHLKYFDIK